MSDFNIRLFDPIKEHYLLPQVADVLKWLSLNPSANRYGAKDLLVAYKYVFVAEDTSEGRIVGTASLLIENKLIHNCGRVGHIEDVVVDEYYRHQNIGRELIDTCIEHARKCECYKVVLSCNEANVPFYERCGFRVHEVTMRLDI